MYLRVRHPGKPPADVDLGPCPEVRSSLGGSVQAAPVGYMSPVILGTVHSGMSDGHGTPKAQAFSIHPESRWALRRPVTNADGRRRPYEFRARCGYILPRAGEPCHRMTGHSTKGGGEGHRGKTAVLAEIERKRERRMAA